MLCPICKRPLGIERLEEHHLVPKTFGGKETVTVHKICHQKVHATFSERELQHHYHTPARILEHSEIQKFVKWIAKKPLDYYDKNDETQTRRRKRRR